MNLSRRVFDDISQLIGSRENPTPLVRLNRLPQPGGKSRERFGDTLQRTGLPALESFVKERTPPSRPRDTR